MAPQGVGGGGGGGGMDLPQVFGIDAGKPVEETFQESFWSFKTRGFFMVALGIAPAGARTAPFALTPHVE